MEAVSTVLRLPVQEATQVGDARRQVARWTEALNFDATRSGKLALIITEAAGNLVKHASDGGELLVRALARNEAPGIEVLSLDCGPGMADIAGALRDGYSTAGSPGTGLGAISRLADEFAIHSAPGIGTAILARVRAGGAEPDLPPGSLEAGGVAAPMTGEEVCGDAWTLRRDAGHTRVMVADGLGHGPDASVAAQEAVRVFHAAPAEIGLPDLMERMHNALRSTRGAAVAVANVDAARDKLRYAGIGNISGTIVHPGAKQSMVSHPGIVGHRMQKVQEFEYSWTAESLLVMHSDGVDTRWDLNRYPGLALRDPALIAGVIYRDHQLGRDDATVLVARHPARAWTSPS